MVALIALGTFILVRAYNRDRVTRRRHLIRAAVLIGLGVLLWLLVIDVFLFTQSAGPGVAAVCGLACLPTTAFGLLVMPAGNFFTRQMERAADLYALRTTGKGMAFRSVMLKLASQNLSEAEPPAWVRFLFYSHPTVGERTNYEF